MCISPIPSAAMGDEELVIRTLAGDTTAFDVLAVRYRSFVQRLAVRLTPNGFDAEEVTQETLLNAYRGIGAYRRDGRFSTWLYRITVNTALMRIRAGKRRRTEPLDDQADTIECRPWDRADQLVARKQLAQGIQGALDRLDVRQRTAFVLRAVESRSMTEVAQSLSVSRSAARQLVYRARKKLRRQLAPLREAA